MSEYAITMQVTAYDDETLSTTSWRFYVDAEDAEAAVPLALERFRKTHLDDGDRVLQINHLRVDPPQSVWDEVHGIEWSGDALHDPDCPMTNSDPAARTSCICDRSQWATEDGSHRTVQEGGGEA